MRATLIKAAALAASLTIAGCGGTTRTVVETVTSLPPASTSTATASSAKVQSFSGNGGKTIGTINVPTDSTIQWTNDGSVFILEDSTGAEVNSQAHSGTSDLAAGTYNQVKVTALGSWTIKIIPK